MSCLGQAGTSRENLISVQNFGLLDLCADYAGMKTRVWDDWVSFRCAAQTRVLRSKPRMGAAAV